VIDPNQRDIDYLESLNTKVMEVIHNERMVGFHKWLPMYDPTLGLDVLQQV
jgi:hypothetical protein